MNDYENMKIEKHVGKNKCNHISDGPSWTSMGIHHPVYPPRGGLYVERRESAMNGNGEIYF